MKLPGFGGKKNDPKTPPPRDPAAGEPPGGGAPEEDTGLAPPLPPPLPSAPPAPSGEEEVTRRPSPFAGITPPPPRVSSTAIPPGMGRFDPGLPAGGGETSGPGPAPAPRGPFAGVAPSALPVAPPPRPAATVPLPGGALPPPSAPVAPPVPVRAGDGGAGSVRPRLAMPALLRMAVERGASDLHLSKGIPPAVRVDGFLRPLDLPVLSAEDCRHLIFSILNNEQKSKFEANWELDFSLELESVGRFRVNIHRQRGAIEGAFRVVNETIQSIRRLGLPPVIEDLARRDSGLVLVTGPTGSGKTTTLAAMVDLINTERQCMIITIEDPIEYVHSNKRSIVKQREVSSDTKSFGAALRHVLRQDPDVIVIGEMRDLETIATALTAAETGHLVLTTLHTPDVMQTIDRIIDVFPPHQQQQVRIQLANSLEGIVAQQLLPIPGGRGRVVAVEVLVATTAARKIIRTAKTEQITSIIQTS